MFRCRFQLGETLIRIYYGDRNGRFDSCTPELEQKAVLVDVPSVVPTLALATKRTPGLVCAMGYPRDAYSFQSWE